MSAGNSGRQRYTLIALDTAVVVQPAVLFNLVGLWGLLVWLTGRRHPELPWFERLLVGLLEMFLLLSADLGHALAHTVSARLAGAPTDQILVTAGMPRTLYWNDDVTPRVHRLRAVGGPLFNAVGLLASLLLRSLSGPRSLWREAADWSCVGHGFILAGSLMPLPTVDGGTLLKWSLVEHGRPPAEADVCVRGASLAVGGVASVAGLVAAAGRRWLPAAALAAGGLVAIAAGLRKDQ
jgi:hypothetical protein